MAVLHGEEDGGKHDTRWRWGHDKRCSRGTRGRREFEDPGLRELKAAIAGWWPWGKGRGWDAASVEGEGSLFL